MAFSHPYRIDGTGRTAKPASSRAELRDLIELVLFTRPGERPMRPSFGSAVHDLVFAPLSAEMAAVVQHTISGSLQQWLGHVIEVRGVVVTVAAQDGALEVEVSYARRSDGVVETVTFVRRATP